jgi:hypothetical protein
MGRDSYFDSEIAGLRLVVFPPGIKLGRQLLSPNPAVCSSPDPKRSGW